MRDIVFRGMRKDNGEWIYGDLRRWPSGEVGICSNELHRTLLVEPETVGQYIGLEDGKGERVFEGDMMMFYDWEGKEKQAGTVEYGAFNCSCCEGVYGWYLDGGDIRGLEEQDNDYKMYVKGNRHETMKKEG